MAGIKPHVKGIKVPFNWNCKRHRPTLTIEPTPRNMKYAENLLGEINRYVGMGLYTLEMYTKHFPTSRLARSAPKKTIDTFNDAADKWEATLSYLATGTLSNYRKALNFWRDKLGDMDIDTIPYSLLAAIANSQSWKPKYRNEMMIPVRQVFKMAKQDGQITDNPTENIKNLKVQKQPPDPFELSEVDLILEALRKRYSEQVENYYEFAFFTGVRPEEEIVLKWTDIDFNSHTARIQRVRTAKTDRDTTKTSSVRDIELNSRAMTALIRQKQHTFLKDDYVFHNPVTNKRWNSEQAQRKRYWTPTLKALGLRHRTQYQTRHTFATMNLMAGANPMWVARQLGHATMQMLLTVYAKWIDGADKSQEKNKLEAKFTSNWHKDDTKNVKMA
jgi:integrase